MSKATCPAELSIGGTCGDMGAMMNGDLINILDYEYDDHPIGHAKRRVEGQNIVTHRLWPLVLNAVEVGTDLWSASVEDSVSRAG